MGANPRRQPEWTWYREILDQIPSGVDSTQIEERLRLTPTERLERMRQFLVFLEEAGQTRGGRLSKAD